MMYDTLTPPDFAGGGIAIARASKTDPSTWFKYYNGAFTEHGLGGLRTILIPLGSQRQQSWAGSVIWSSALGRFLMVHTDYSHEGTIYLRTSPDLLTWSASTPLFGPSTTYGYRFPTLIGMTDDETMAGTAWLYFGRHLTSGAVGPGTLMARRSFSLEALVP
jgi:hypothetical protein